MLAWLLIVLAGFATFLSVLQILVYFALSPGGEMGVALPEVSGADPSLAIDRLVITHFGVILVAVLALTLLTLVGAIGFWKRRGWTRYVVIAVMGLAIAWSLGSVVFQELMLSQVLGGRSASPAADEQVQALMMVARVGSVVVAGSFCALFGWIIRRRQVAAVLPATGSRSAPGAPGDVATAGPETERNPCPWSPKCSPTRSPVPRTRRPAPGCHEPRFGCTGPRTATNGPATGGASSIPDLPATPQRRPALPRTSSDARRSADVS